MVEDQEDLLPDRGAQLVRILHHLHDPAELWSSGQSVADTHKKTRTRIRTQLDTQAVSFIVASQLLP